MLKIKTFNNKSINLKINKSINKKINEMSGKVVILSAPSGAGKTTIVKHLLNLDLNLEFSISACSREKRAGEKENVDYYYLTPDDFKEKVKNNEFVEWEEVYEGNYYGTLKTEIERIWSKGNNVLFEVDVKGGINLKKLFGNKALSVFIKPPSVNALRERLKARSTESDDVIEKRMKRAEEELLYVKEFDIAIVNDNLEKAKEETYEAVKKFLNI